MTNEEALQLFSRLCAASVSRTLAELVPSLAVEEPKLVANGRSPFDGVATPGVSATVEQDDGLGESVLVLSEEAAQAIADAAGEDVSRDAAVGEAARRAAAAVAAAAGSILDQTPPVGEPELRAFATADEAATPSERSAHAFVLGFSVGGEPGRFVQRVHNAFLVKAAPLLADIAFQSEALVQDAGLVPTETLHDVKVRAWVELGRTKLPLAQTVSLPSGAVVQLDRGADDPVELYVNGTLFAEGRLVVLDAEWAVEIERLVYERGGGSSPAPQPAAAAVDNGER